MVGHALVRAATGALRCSARAAILTSCTSVRRRFCGEKETSLRRSARPLSILTSGSPSQRMRPRAGLSARGPGRGRRVRRRSTAATHARDVDARARRLSDAIGRAQARLPNMRMGGSPSPPRLSKPEIRRVPKTDGPARRASQPAVQPTPCRASCRHASGLRARKPTTCATAWPVRHW